MKTPLIAILFGPFSLLTFSQSYIEDLEKKKAAFIFKPLNNNHILISVLVLSVVGYSQINIE